MDIYNKDGKVDIFRDIFDGKTDEEIVSLCEEFLGEFNGNYFNNKLIEERGRYSRSLALDNLRDAINEMREEKMEISAEDRESVLKDFGMTGAKTPLSALANRVIQEEATEIVRQGFSRTYVDEPMDKDELERRINLVFKCCGKDTFSYLIQTTIPQFYYGEGRIDIDDIDRINKDLPQFFQTVDYLVSNGIDISKIEMAKGMNLQEVYMEVSQNYAKFFGKENKEEKTFDEPKIVEEKEPIDKSNDEINRMVNDSNHDETLQYYLLQEMQEIQKEINQLMARQANVLARLQEIQKYDANQVKK